jgi:hypothetical protein
MTIPGSKGVPFSSSSSDTHPKAPWDSLACFSLPQSDGGPRHVIAPSCPPTPGPRSLGVPRLLRSSGPFLAHQEWGGGRARCPNFPACSSSAYKDACHLGGGKSHFGPGPSFSSLWASAALPWLGKPEAGAPFPGMHLVVMETFFSLSPLHPPSLGPTLPGRVPRLAPAVTVTQM